MTFQYEFNKNDEYITPKNAVYPIIKYLQKGSTIWCPFDTKESNFVNVLKENNFKVIYSHISKGQDFFKMQVPKCDYIISNPPYSKKEKVFERLFEIKKPFAMLVNPQGLFDSKKRFKMFKENRTELIYLSPRVRYLGSKDKETFNVPFQSCYVCSNFCKKRLNFEYLE